nr:MAG TPA: adenine-specific methyltransferase [Caudoviricetes sp.]
MIELNKIYNEDCLEGMKRIPDGSVDCIVCDLPYEVLNKGNEKVRWDNIIPMEPLFKEYWRIAKTNAPIILFGQGMFTAQLMMAEPDTWRYNLIWQKDRPTGFLNAKRMPMRSHEDIAVFYRALPTYNPQMRQGSPLIHEDINKEKQGVMLVMATIILRPTQKKQQPRNILYLYCSSTKKRILICTPPKNLSLLFSISSVPTPTRATPSWTTVWAAAPPPLLV